MRGIDPASWHRHRFANWLQTVLLILALLGICAFTGSLILGESGLWFALFAGLLALAIEPAAAAALTLRLYGARPLGIDETPAIHHMLRELARRAELPAVPAPHYVASRVVNALPSARRGTPPSRSPTASCARSRRASWLACSPTR
jgi:heat shock protein HtpX